MWFSCMKKLFSWYFRHIFEYFITQLDNFSSTKLQHTMLNLRKRTRNSLNKFPILFLFVNFVDLTAKIKGSISPFSFSCCFWFCVVFFSLSGSKLLSHWGHQSCLRTHNSKPLRKSCQASILAVEDINNLHAWIYIVCLIWKQHCFLFCMAAAIDDGTFWQVFVWLLTHHHHPAR